MGHIELFEMVKLPDFDELEKRQEEINRTCTKQGTRRPKMIKHIFWHMGESYQRCRKCGCEQYSFLYGDMKTWRRFDQQLVCKNCGEKMITCNNRNSKELLGYELGYAISREFLIDYLIGWYNAQEHHEKVENIWGSDERIITRKQLKERLQPIFSAMQSLDGWKKEYVKYIVGNHDYWAANDRLYGYSSPYSITALKKHFYIDENEHWVKNQQTLGKYPPQATDFVNKDMFAFLRFLRKNFSYDGQALVKQLTDAIEANCNSSMTQLGFDAAQKLDSIQIREHLEKLINVETSIYSLSNRMESLYFDENECVQNYRMGFASDIKALQDKRNKLHMEYTRLLGKGEPIVNPLELIPPIARRDMTPQYPPAPMEPEKPVMEEPKFFNRNKVEKANQAKTEAYKKAYQEWEAKVRERSAIIEKLEQQATDEYNSTRKAMAEEYAPMIQQEQEKRTAEYKNALATAKAAYEDVEKEIEINKKEIASNKLPLTLEKEQAEQLMKNLIEARHKLLSANIIFPKYRNIVAYTTMYEYFVTGRCDSLEGPTGAYNLYESEVRANMIISQLSTVISSLEKIKDNQYMLYNELQNVNRQLDSLNSTTANMANMMASMQGDIATIADNSDAIAYNTAKTAYYSELNAKLTDALGYMVALS